MSLKLLPLTAAIALVLSGCNSDNSTFDGKDNIETPIDQSVLQYVDPLIGTADAGHTFPGAVVPSGMVQLSPDTQLTGWHSSSGYHDPSDYTKGTIIDKDLPLYGFSHTHLSGTGIGGLGDISFLPFSLDNQSEKASFAKVNEVAQAGFYQVTLDESDIKVELTASERVGFHRYTFAPDQPQQLKVDLNTTLNTDWGSKSMRNKITIIDDYTIIGERDSHGFGGWSMNQRVYFYAKFDHKIKSIQLTVEGEPVKGNSAESISRIVTDDAGKKRRIQADVTAFIEFEPSNEPVVAKVALSPVSTEGAEKNYQQEANITFDQAKQQAKQKWAESLNDIKVTGGSADQKEIFYTALYHTKIAPMIHQDVDGQYRGMADGTQVQNFTNGEGETNYSVYSMWDTFRSLHPLKTITEPERAVEYAKNLIKKQQEGGLLPKWELHGDYSGTMVGYPAVSIIADAMIKYPESFSDQERKDALTAALASSNYHPEDFQHWHQGLLNKVLTPHIKYIAELGFAPAVERDGEGNLINGTTESVSYGLENAYYDWCIAQMAKLAGSDAIYLEYMKRSKAYKRYFDHNPARYAEHNSTGFMRPIMSDGSWSTPFDPYNAVHETGNYTEGNAWQWTWFVPHDINGLKYVMGGEEAFLSNLDALFNAKPLEGTADMTGLIGQYVHGNEPDHHVAYLYNYTSEPWKTQEYVDYILDTFYTTLPNGIIGNEDVGAMSSWYVMSALGFYQVSPGSTVYTIGRPLFDEADIPVKGGVFKVIAENNSDDNYYVQSVSINGKPLTDGVFFNHSDIKAGGELRFVMTDQKPN
ncbi:TPA: GH92 family glycosyl hydrolase [Photobacterium damselae]